MPASNHSSRATLAALLLGAALIAAAAIAASVLTAVGVATASVGQPVISGGGHGTFFFGDREFSITASPSGGQFIEAGKVRGAGGPPVLSGDVTCVSVTDNDAVVAGIVRASSNHPDLVGTPFIWYFVDSGVAAQGAPDRVSPAFFLGTDPADWAAVGAPDGFPDVCPLFSDQPSGIAYADLSGDLVVSDAP